MCVGQLDNVLFIKKESSKFYNSLFFKIHKWIIDFGLGKGEVAQQALDQSVIVIPFPLSYSG